MPEHFKCVRNEKHMPHKQCEVCIYKNEQGIPLHPLVKVTFPKTKKKPSDEILPSEIICLTGRAWPKSEDWQNMALHKLDQKGLDPFGNSI